ncbi:hypothetical protein [Spirosoma areae]
MNANQQSPQKALEARVAGLYCEFVDQNPSLKNYIVTMGFRAGYRSDEELRAFCARIDQPRRALALYARAMADVFAQTLSPH